MKVESVDDYYEVKIEPDGLSGFLGIPPGASAIVIFACGCDTDRFCPGKHFIATELRRAGLATFLVDLLSPREMDDPAKVFDIQLLANRLIMASEWIKSRREMAEFAQGYFGASYEAEAALLATVTYVTKEPIKAIVSCGERPDLTMPRLDTHKMIGAATLLLVGSLDGPVVGMNRGVLVDCPQKRMQIIKETASRNLLEKTEAVQEVARHAKDWFLQHLTN